jgi:subtilisin family serine protease
MKGTKILLATTMILFGLVLALPGIVLADDQENAPLVALASVSESKDQYVDKQWALRQIPLIHIDNASNEIIVAVLDTGIDGNHEDLAGKVIESINFSGSQTDKDVNGHGTHVAGIIAANADNEIGIAGAAPNVKLLNVKVAEDNGMVWASKVAKGIIWATDRGAKVINMSLATPSKFQPLEEAVEYAWSHGVVLVAAAGNYNKLTTYPAAYDEVIAVAATTIENEIWSNSNDGKFVDAYAPGAEIFSTLPDNKYGYESGSSMATAYVSAVAAEVFAETADTNDDGKVNDEVLASVEALFPKPVE